MADGGSVCQGSGSSDTLSGLFRVSVRHGGGSSSCCILAAGLPFVCGYCRGYGRAGAYCGCGPLWRMRYGCGGAYHALPDVRSGLRDDERIGIQAVRPAACAVRFRSRATAPDDRRPGPGQLPDQDRLSALKRPGRSGLRPARRSGDRLDGAGGHVFGADPHDIVRSRPRKIIGRSGTACHAVPGRAPASKLTSCVRGHTADPR